ncbi:MAG: DUF1697 domain-containing protein [Gallionella sp.]|nr:DUF1697 domain-containing protein [Gallionella sp.]
MKTYIALFRGINVGGNNNLPMKERKSYPGNPDGERACHSLGLL